MTTFNTPSNGNKKLSSSKSCQCLNDSVVVESVVIVFTLVSCLAITGQLLVEYDVIEVLRDGHGVHHNSSDHYTSSTERPFEFSLVDEDLMDTLKTSFYFTHLGIIGLFVVEVFLKLATLRKVFLRKPVQVFDCILVIADATFQACFYFIPIPRIFYCLSYVIVLRLWRTCFVCTMRTKSLVDDVEHHMSEHLKIREQYLSLQRLALQQEEQLQKMETLRMQFSHLKKSENSEQKPNSLSTHDDFKNNNTPSASFGRKHIINSTDFHSNGVASTKQIQQETNEYYYTDVTDSVRVETERGIEIERRSNSVTKLHYKPRWRRSSTSDFDDSRRLSLYSFGDNISVESDVRMESFSDMLSVQNESSSGDMIAHSSARQSREIDSLENINEAEPPPPLTDLDLDMTDSKQNFQRRNSCPEYMFTQRMKISKYEVMLIEDHGGLNAFDNGAFNHDDDIVPLVDMCQRTEYKTYRSQDGVPTTVL